jgi:hypothetical protein
MAADKTYTLEVVAKGLREAARGIEQLNKETSKLEGTQARATKSNRRHTKSQAEVVEQNKGVSFSTNNATHAFSKMATNMQGTLVPAYATVAANVFALTAAFGALERAADFSILVESAKSLATQTGRSLVTLSEGMQEVTGSAISMKEALTSASIAASAGFDNETILRLTQVARNASVALGREMTDAMNRVFKGAIKAEPELLDELGIILRLDTASRKYAAALGKTVQELSTFEKQQAVVNDVIEQGEKKFGRLAEIDPNPYTQLAAAFHDITTELVNLIGLPIGSVFSFMADNTALLGATMLLFATRVAKFAFPALQNLSEVIDNKVNNSVTKLKTKIDVINAQKLKIIDATDAARLTKTLERVDSAIDDSVLGFQRMGKEGSKGFQTLEHGALNAQQKLVKFKQVYTSYLRLLRSGQSAGGFEATSANIKRIEQDLKRVNLELDILRGNTSKGIFLSFNEQVARARLGLADFTAAMQRATLQATKFVNESTLGFTGLVKAIKATAAETTGLTRVFAILGATVSGIISSVFKLLGPIFSLIIAWELLGSAVSFVYELFAGKPEADLGATLGDLESQLEEVTSASINYRENLASLPPTIENVTDKVELQSNALGELSSIIKNINTDLKVLDGFDSIDKLLGIIGLGNVSELEDVIEKVLTNLRNLGEIEAVNNLFEEFGDISELNADELVIFNRRLGETLNKLNELAAGSKEAINNLNTDITEVGKNLSSLVLSFGRLTDAEKIALGLDSIINRFDTIGASALTISTALSNLSSVEAAGLGISDEIEHAAKLSSELEKLIEVEQDAIDSRDDFIREMGGKSGGVFLSVQFKEASAEVARATFAIHNHQIQMEKYGKDVVKALKEGKNAFTKFIDATKEYNDIKQQISIEDLLNVDNVKNFADILDQSLRNEQKFLKSSTILQQNILGRQQAIASAARKAIQDAELSLIQLGKDSEGTQQYRQLQITLNTARNAEAEANKQIRILQNGLEQTRLKGVNILTKDITTLLKEFGKLSKLSLFGSEVYENDIEILRRTLIKRLKGLHVELNTEDAEEQLRSFAKKLKSDRIFEAEITLIGIKNVEDIVAQTNKIIQDTAALARETTAINAIRSSETGIEESFRSDYGSIVQERIALNQLEQLQIQQFELHNHERQQEYNNLIAAQHEKINAIRERGAEEATEAALAELISIQKKLFLIRKEAAFGNQLNKIDKQRLKIEELKAKHSGSENLDEIIDKQQKINSLVNKMDFSEQIKEGAEAMNELADSMNTFFENMEIAGDSPFDQLVSGLLLIQNVSDQMDNSFGKLGKGFATLGLAAANYSNQLKTINKAVIDGQYDQTTATLKKQQAALMLGANAAGAMAGAFEEGSTAAKAFTIVQQGLAIASAAVAVLQQGQGDPYSAFARIAAMLSLVATVLGAFGIAGGSTASGETGPTAVESFRNENIGDQGIHGRTLKTNTLIDSVDELVAIDTKLYGVTRDLEITMSKMSGIFETLAAVLINTYMGVGGVSGFANVGSVQTDVTSGFDSIARSLASTVGTIGSVLSLGLDFGLFDKIGGEISNFFSNTRTVSRLLLDAGIEFQIALNSLGEGITGSLDAFIFTIEAVEDRTTHTFHSDSVTNYIEDQLHFLDVDVQNAFRLAFGDIINGVSLLVTEFANNAENINLESLFRGINLLDVSGRTTLLNEELENMTDEEATETIAAFFSGMTSDIAEAIFPFLVDFQRAGEELGDTLLRLTTETILVNNALATISAGIADYTTVNIEQIDIESQVQRAMQIVSGEIRRGLWSFTSATNMAGFRTAVNDISKAVLDIFSSSTFQNEEQIRTALNTAAEVFRIEVMAAWNEALLDQFKDAEEFNEIFATFSSTIFDEAEMATFAIERATTSLQEGFDDLIDQAIEIGRGDLASILQEGISPESLRAFYDLADATGAFAVQADFATGTINTAGADLLGTAVSLGPAFELLEESQKILDDLMEAIEDLNNQYVQQIALFGKLGKEAELLSLAFDFADALEEAKETGSNLALVEQAFGLERLGIVNKYYNDINDEIESTMNNIMDSVIEVSRNSDVWDDIAFSIIKINKLVTQLNKGTSGINLGSLVTDTSEFTEFIENFQEVIDSISEEGPGSVSEEIQLVDDLRNAITDRYSLELALLEDQQEAYKDLSLEIRSYLDDILLSDVSPLTNLERLTEAESQFLANAANIFSEDEDIAAKAAEDILSSADAFLEAASGFFSIGPEYQKVFNQVTSTLEALDIELLAKKDETVLAIEQLNTDIIDQLGILDSILIELQSQNEDVLILDTAAAITEGMTPLIGEIISKLQSIDDGSWTQMISILEVIAATGLSNTGNIETIVTPDSTFDYNTLTGIIESTPVEIISSPEVETIIYTDPVMIDSLSEILSSIGLTNTLLADGSEQILALFDSLMFPISDNVTDLSTIPPETQVIGIEPNVTMESMASGAPEIPYDMVVQVHKGETIVPESMAEGIRNGTLSLGEDQDNSDIIEAIKELTGILAISQEDIVDAANKNVEVSREIANSLSNVRQPVKTSGVL